MIASLHLTVRVRWLCVFNVARRRACDCHGSDWHASEEKPKMILSKQVPNKVHCFISGTPRSPYTLDFIP